MRAAVVITDACVLDCGPADFDLFIRSYKHIEKEQTDDLYAGTPVRCKSRVTDHLLFAHKRFRNSTVAHIFVLMPTDL